MNDTKIATALASWKTPFHKYCDSLLKTAVDKRMVWKSQHNLELITGIKGELHDWDVECDIGSMHCSQVGEYANSGVLVEDYRIWPFQISMERGVSRLLDTSEHDPFEGHFHREVKVEDRSWRPLIRHAQLHHWDDSAWEAVEGECTSGAWGHQVSAVDGIHMKRLSRLMPLDKLQQEVTCESSAAEHERQDVRWWSLPSSCESNSCTTSSPQKPKKTQCNSPRLLRTVEEEVIVRRTSQAPATKTPARRPAVEVSVRIIAREVFSMDWLQKENTLWHAAVQQARGSRRSNKMQL